MSTQELELAILYAYNPPGVGEEAAQVKAQVKYDLVGYLPYTRRIEWCVCAVSAHVIELSSGYLSILWDLSCCSPAKVFRAQLVPIV